MRAGVGAAHSNAKPAASAIGNLRIVSLRILGAWGQVSTPYTILIKNAALINGLNGWLAQDAQVSINYRLIDLDRFGGHGVSAGVNTRLLLILD